MKYFHLLAAVGLFLAAFCVRGVCDLNPSGSDAVNPAPELIANSKMSPNDSKSDTDSPPTVADDTKTPDSAAEAKDKITDEAVLDNSDLSNSKE